MSTWTFKTDKGRRWHTGALLYSLMAYGAGWWLLLSQNGFAFLPGILLLGHGMIIAAYLIHECAHNTIFTVNRHNNQLAGWLGWICGSCYGTVEDIRTKHFRHHVENDDVVWFDYEGFFKRHSLVYRMTIFLEWCFIPAHCILMHTIMVFTAFIIPQRRNQLARNVSVIAIEALHRISLETTS